MGSLVHSAAANGVPCQMASILSHAPVTPKGMLPQHTFTAASQTVLDVAKSVVGSVAEETAAEHLTLQVAALPEACLLFCLEGVLAMLLSAHFHTVRFCTAPMACWYK